MRKVKDNKDKSFKYFGKEKKLNKRKLYEYPLLSVLCTRTYKKYYVNDVHQ